MSRSQFEPVMAALFARAQRALGGVATNLTFATPNQQLGPFQLLTALGYPVIGLIGAPSIYQTDWQGTNLLVATPRTNLVLHSQAINSWPLQNLVTIAGTALAPDGSLTAQTIVATAVAGTHYAADNSITIVIGQTYRLIGYLAAAGQNYAVVQLDSAAANLGGVGCFDLVNGLVTTQPIGGTASISSGPSGYWRIQIDATATGTTASMGVEGSPTSSSGFSSYTGDGTSGIKAWGFQLTLPSEAGDYIPTLASAATVTDYTLSGTQVTLGQNPAAGATLQWSGDYGFLSLSSRRPKQPQETALQDCPALYQIEGSFKANYAQNQPGIVWDISVGWIVIVAQNDPTQPMTPALNPILDALCQILAPQGQPSSQTLGGLAEYCAIEGSIDVFEGVIADRAVAIIPIRIVLAGF